MLSRLSDRQITKQQLQQKVESDFTLLPNVVDGVSSSKATVRYGCANILVNLSQKFPERVYPYFNFFVSLLDSKYRILVWNGMAALANLCATDIDNCFDAIFDKYYGFLRDEYMVTVANVVANSAKIARSKPYLVPRITTELLGVSKISTSPHMTEECKLVIAEHTVESFDEFFDLMGNTEKARVINFVKQHSGQSRISLRQACQIFLKNRSLTEGFPKP